MVNGLPAAVKPDSLVVEFDDERLIANAGLLLTSTLSGRLGLERLVEETVDLGERPGAARPGRKVLSLVHAMAAGADSIDDCDLLRAGGTEAVLGHRAMAPSTLGTFLRSFTFGHVRQLDRVLAESIGRAWAAGAGPGEGRLVIDIDSFVGEVHGCEKQGAAFGYTGERGYHPLLATRSGTGEVLHVRQRKGSAGSGRGALRFVSELFACGRHFAFVPNRSEDMRLVDREHRQHAEVELAIRDLKDQALAHFPSGRFAANAAWSVIACLAHNLQRWTGMLGLQDPTPRTARTIRRWLLALPGRLTRTARQWTLHLPARWPWQHALTEALTRIRALPAPD